MVKKSNDGIGKRMLEAGSSGWGGYRMFLTTNGETMSKSSVVENIPRSGGLKFHKILIMNKDIIDAKKTRARLLKNFSLLAKKLTNKVHSKVQQIHLNLLRILLHPKKILSSTDDTDVKLHTVRLEKCTYVVAEVPNGRIFTDRGGTIAVTSGRKLVPSVSFQYFQEKILSDHENFFLTRRTTFCLPPQYISGCVVSLLTGGGGNRNYYHWMYDVLPKLYLVKRKVKSIHNVKYLIPERTLPFQKETLPLVGIEPMQIISSQHHPYILADYCVATSHPNATPAQVPLWVIKFLRQSLLKHASANKFSPFVWIERGDSANNRRMENETELLSGLQSIGFHSYRLSTMSVKDQIALFSNAKMIIGVHGAGFANLAFATKGTIVYELLSERYVPTMYQSISYTLGLEHHSIISKDSEEQVRPLLANFRLSDPEVSNILKQAKRIVRKNR